MAALTDEELDRLEGALHLQLQDMGYRLDVDVAGPQGQFPIYCFETQEWWVVTIVDDEGGELELARHHYSSREDRLGYFDLADPACFDKMKAHIDLDNNSSR